VKARHPEDECLDEPRRGSDEWRRHRSSNFVNSGGFIGELEITFLLEFVIAAVLDGRFHFCLLLAGGDFFG
jgi:hypothetical protein